MIADFEKRHCLEFGELSTCSKFGSGTNPFTGRRACWLQSTRRGPDALIDIRTDHFLVGELPVYLQ